MEASTKGGDVGPEAEASPIGQMAGTLLVGGKGFSVVYNTWCGFLSLCNYNFNCIF
jgi:hypothetical protein